MRLWSGWRNICIALLLPLSVSACAGAVHENVLNNFAAFPNGAQPQANLIVDAAGNLFGTTAQGGRFNQGTVFKLSPVKEGNWSETVLYSFSGRSDGGQPLAGLVMDSAGNLYGTTLAGGAFGSCPSYQGCGVVFELSAADGGWTGTTLYEFGGYPDDGQAPTASLVFDSAGNLYGTTSAGGTADGGTVFRLSPSRASLWTETILHNFSGLGDGGAPYAALTLDSQGNLYGTASLGGYLNCDPIDPFDTRGCGVVFQLQTNGDGNWTENVLHTFTYNDGAYPKGNVIFDAEGNLYGTTYSGPGFACFEGCGTVFEMSPAPNNTWTQTIIYNFEGGSDGYEPIAGLIADAGGDLLGITEGGGWPRCPNYNCGTVFALRRTKKGTWHKTTIHRFGFGGSVADLGDGNEPLGSLAIDSLGNLYGTTALGGAANGSCAVYGTLRGCGTIFQFTRRAGQQWTFNRIYAFPAGIAGLTPRAGLLADNNGNLYGTAGAGGNSRCYQINGPSGCGTVFELQTQPGGTWRKLLLHTFNGIDGSGPAGKLIADAAGNLYGTASNGGGDDCIGYYEPYCGTVFELSPSPTGWKLSVIHRFRASPSDQHSDGARPLSGLTIDASGNLYGTTSLGGSGTRQCTIDQYFGCGTVYELSPAGNGLWTENILYRFQGGSDGQSPIGPVTFGPDGALYGTTCSGGANSGGTVFRLTPGPNGSWSETVLYGFSAWKGDGFCPYGGVVFDAQGNLYGTTFEGGNYGNLCETGGGCGVVFELSPSGATWSETVILAFIGSDGSNPTGTLSVDSSGNLYGSTSNSGQGWGYGGTIFALSPGPEGWTEHVLHHFGNGFDGDNPNGDLVIDPLGNIFGTTNSGGTDRYGGTLFELARDSTQDWQEAAVGESSGDLSPRRLRGHTAPPDSLPMKLRQRGDK